MVWNSRWGSLVLALVAASWLSGCVERGQASSPDGARGSIQLKPCIVTMPSSSIAIKARCGHLDVPENWKKPKGRTIRLNLAVVPARHKTRSPDPLFFFSGGPGQAATETYPQMSRAFQGINRNRDVVLIDQRGTGRSHPIHCPKNELHDLKVEPTQAQIKADIEKCVASFKGKTDLRQYTTTASVRDFDAVRKALGYGKINIYGISYGTRVAQRYMKMFPQHLRSVIIDGVAPESMVLGWDTSVNAPARVRKWLIMRCKADPRCHQAFPTLAKTLDVIERRIKARASVMTFTHPRTHKRFEARVSWFTWGLGFRLFGYSSGMVAVLPLLLEQSKKQNDLRPILKWVLAQMEDLSRVISSLENSVLCAEDWPFLKAAVARRKAPVYYGAKRLKVLATLCKYWPHGTVGADFKKPVVSTLPTLVLSGQFDPVTPPAFGAEVAKHLANSKHVVVPGEGHGAIGHGCVPGLATQFIKAGSVKDLDASCIKNHKPLGFFIDFAGPALTNTAPKSSPGATRPKAPKKADASKAPKPTTRPKAPRAATQPTPRQREATTRPSVRPAPARRQP